jgi:hypothetical protein
MEFSALVDRDRSPLSAHLLFQADLYRSAVNSHTTASDTRTRVSERNESVGGGLHPSGMSEMKTSGIDTRSGLGRFLMRGRLVDVDLQGHLR